MANWVSQNAWNLVFHVQAKLLCYLGKQIVAHAWLESGAGQDML